MPHIGGLEPIWLIVVLILLFGAKKLPELGSSIGKSIKNFKKGIDEAHAEDEEPRVKTSPSKPVDHQ
ncbi:MAG: twin-arginine translocase TatA/TatE family subunit [Egibacteraceae bacterium]